MFESFDVLASSAGSNAATAPWRPMAAGDAAAGKAAAAGSTPPSLGGGIAICHPTSSPNCSGLVTNACG